MANQDRIGEYGMDVFEMHLAGHPACEIAQRLGISSGSVLNYLRRLDLTPRRPGPRSGIHTSLDRDGYVMVKASGDPTYEAMIAHRRTRSPVRCSRWVMAKSLGRLLESHETVHHKNGDRTDDRPENLELRTGMHGPGVALRCRACGSHDIQPTQLQEA